MRPSSAYTTDELVELCIAIRHPKQPLSVELDHVLLIEQLASDLRAVREANAGATSPPSCEARRLRVIGWLMYEVSLQSLQKVPAAWESLLSNEPLAFETAEKYDGFVDHVANSARFLAWREFSPRALGAIRAQALASSKRDTDSGYARAWLLHREADFLHDLYRDQVSGDRDLECGYLETLVQLRLAETGTACRTAEYAIIEEFAPDLRRGVARRDQINVPERARINKLFRDLEAGASFGEQAIDVVGEIKNEHGLVNNVDEDRIALDTSFRNPGIMTARAYLLMYPVTALLKEQDRRTWRNLSTWKQAREELLGRFLAAYRAVEHTSSTKQLSKDHQRSIVQLRLNLALVCPGLELPSELTPELKFADCLERSVLDADAIEELSQWLSEKDEAGKRRGDANVIGSATMPSYLESIRLVLGDDADWQRYLDWRRTWFELDRHAAEEGRFDVVMAALDAATT